MGNKWNTVRLGDYCIKIGSGATPKGGNSVYTDTGNTYFIRSQNVYNDGFNTNGLVFITDEAALKLKNVDVQESDILLNITGDSVARVCIAPRAFLPARVNQHVAIIRPKNDAFDPRFLRYFLSSPQQQALLLTLASAGATRNALTKGMIEDLQVPKPHVHTQISIANVLENFDKKIESNNKINQTLEQMSQTLFKSWFVDFDPVIDNALDAANLIPEALQSRAELRQKVRNSADFKPLPADIRALFPAEFEETELGCVPKGWKISTAGDELVVKGGSTPSTSNADFWENGTIHWTSPKDLAGNDSKVLLDTSKKITELGLIKISSGLLPTDTVLMSSRAPIGYLAIAKTPMAINQGYIAIPSSKNLSPEYIIYWLENIMDDIKGMAGGTTFAEISKSAFKTINLVIPSKNVLAEFTRLAHQHFEKVVSNARQITALTNFRDTLLPKLISGELSLEDLPDIIKQTEAA
ncbi:restriction endonuclease subunit S [Enterobacter bugandensis]|uniref:restriction endonuclease subunit S n=1 Tax=Enterobacter bugandensis TaxID=881260 RepID=UPI001D0C9E77|nr:restriction endonuclease subunit S [Enterobacter bugandensis]MCC2001531.1 restriction endonuclease subunit S [Enterobacter bugandensis]MDH2700163.1 restriction endonuclease subunit S [Enterobacter bugandensis]